MWVKWSRFHLVVDGISLQQHLLFLALLLIFKKSTRFTLPKSGHCHFRTSNITKAITTPCYLEVCRILQVNMLQDLITNFWWGGGTAWPCYQGCFLVPLGTEPDVGGELAAGTCPPTAKLKLALVEVKPCFMVQFCFELESSQNWEKWGETFGTKLSWGGQIQIKK